MKAGNPWEGLHVVERHARDETMVPLSKTPYEYLAVHHGAPVAHAMTKQGLAELLWLGHYEDGQITVYHLRTPQKHAYH